MNEEKEKERRRLNLIIYNAPESTAKLAESCKLKISSMFNVYLGANDIVTKVQIY